MKNSKISISTKGRDFYPISLDINSIISGFDLELGLCNIFIKHTSCSLIISENCDQKVLKDLEFFMSKLIPDGEEWLTHMSEGDDDMPSHIRSVLTCSNLSIPILNGVLGLGVWQEVYLWEHRLKSHSREILVSLLV